MSDNADRERITPHNHVTRDVKESGKCPACDKIHEAQAEVREFQIWRRERETWYPSKDAPFWDRLGVHGDLAAHLPIGVNERGQGPTDPEPAHHYECWCGDVECSLTMALQHAWSAGRRSK